MMNKYLKSALYLTFLIFFVLFTACDNEPIDVGIINDGEGVGSCEDTTQILVTASTNFSSATPEDENYTTLCVTYANALQNVIATCGDTDGALQATIDGLNCEVINQEDSFLFN